VHDEAARRDARRALPHAGGEAFASFAAHAGTTPPPVPEPRGAGFVWQAGPSPTVSSAGNYILDQFERLAHEYEAQRRELLRAHERLNIALDLSQELSSCDDPAAMEANLLERYARSLAAAAVLLDRGDHCPPVETGGNQVGLPLVTPSRVRDRLGAEIDAVRRTGQARHLNLPWALEHELGDVHVLLSALQVETQRSQVVITLRRGQQAPFSSDDRLASETVLVCGGQILRNLLMVQRLQHASLETVGALANAIEARDHYTGGHSDRVGWLATLTGRVLGLSPRDLQMLEWAGMLHDVGKLGIPEHILNKPGSLTPDEFEQIKRHPRLGYDVLAPVSSLSPVLEAVLYHHENYDGSGYPDGLRGAEIPMLARILHVVDVFDALTSTRSYRERLAIDQALALLVKDAGRTTDPTVTAAFVRAFRDYRRLQPEDCRQRFVHV
jgi:HD-GYP domain-containing protein (c-di-GMP phosphodiesterase class II)